MTELRADRVGSRFTPPHALKMPVLFLVFNRIDTTRQVFGAIRDAKPPKLYIAADGARVDREGEYEKTEIVRNYVLENIDWECSVKTLFRKDNLGCKYAVSDAIRWFFEEEEMGIILEDDCLPSLSFFWYCENLLRRYKEEMRVGHIGGSNFQGGQKRGAADYYFSIFGHIWGWATWANRWKNYDVELEKFHDSGFISDIKHIDRIYWERIYDSVKKKNLDTWDYQWTFTLWKERQLAALPNVNLVKNIGFGAEATHTKRVSEFANLRTFELLVERHPEEIVQHETADKFTTDIMFSRKTLLDRAAEKITRALGWRRRI